MWANPLKLNHHTPLSVSVCLSLSLSISSSSTQFSFRQLFPNGLFVLMPYVQECGSITVILNLWVVTPGSHVSCLHYDS